MGDRCYVRVTFRESDTPKVNEILGGGENPFDELEDDGRPGVVVGIAFEANYGWVEEMLLLARAGVPFQVYNGAGSEYGDGLGVSTGDGKIVEAGADMNGYIIARIDPKTGDPVPDDLQAARAFIAAEKKVGELFGAAGSPAGASS